MKELNDALERAKEQLEAAKVFDYGNEQIAHDIRETVYAIFPQLKETEHEGIRKALVNMFSFYNIQKVGNYTNEQILKWLEGQRERPRMGYPTGHEERDGHNQTASDLIVSVGDGSDGPKYKVGDWLVATKHGLSRLIRIIGHEQGRYEIEKMGGDTGVPSFGYVEEYYRPWAIQDANDGDVLATKDNCICIFDGTVEEGKYPFAYCGISMYGFRVYDGKLPFTHDDVYPATKEQRDLLFQKMKEAGYEWDSDKKEVIRLSTNTTEERNKVIDELINFFRFQSKVEPSKKGTHDRWIGWLNNMR